MSATVAAKISVAVPMMAADVGGGGRQLEQRVAARDQVHARGDHRGRVDQGGHRRRALHGVGQPRVQRQLSGLGERPHQDQQAGRHELAVVATERLLCAGEHVGVVQRAGAVEEQEGADHQARVADHVDHERLDPGRGGRRAAVPEGDQQVGGRAHEGPAHDEQHEVGRQDQQQHREDEEVQVGEEARVALVAGHVGHRVEVDQERHARHHQAHEHRERVHEDRHVGLEARGVDVGEPGAHQRAAVLGPVLERDQHRDRGRERRADGRAGDPAGQPPRERPPAERHDGRAHQRAGQHDPTPVRRAHGSLQTFALRRPRASAWPTKPSALRPWIARFSGPSTINLSVPTSRRRRWAGAGGTSPR